MRERCELWKWCMSKLVTTEAVYSCGWLQTTSKAVNLTAPFFSQCVGTFKFTCSVMTGRGGGWSWGCTQCSTQQYSKVHFPAEPPVLPWPGERGMISQPQPPLMICLEAMHFGGIKKTTTAAARFYLHSVTTQMHVHVWIFSICIWQ